jgi:AcrR family transcriptional regulator
LNRVLGEPKGKGAPFSKRKLEVFKAAAKLFNDRGFNSATMDDIAAALHVTKPALYYYAKSKDEILFEIGRIALRDAAGLLDRVGVEGTTGAERLKQFFIAWTESICQEFGRCLILAKPELLEPDSQKLNRENRRKVHQQVITLIESGVEDGSIKSCDPHLLSLALFDLFNGITYWYKEDGSLTPREIAGEYWSNFACGFLSD